MHADFFEQYIRGQVLPFAQEFSRRSSLVADAFFHGADVSDLGSWTWEELFRKPQTNGGA